MLALVRNSERFLIGVASITLFFLMVITFCDVLMRSIFNAPIEAATELIRVSIGIMVFAAMPVISGRNQHICVDLFDGFFEWFHLDRIRDGLLALVCGGMLFWPVQKLAVLAQRAHSYGDHTEYLDIPVSYVTWFITIMTAVTGIVLVLRGIILLFAPKLLAPELLEENS